MAAIGSADEEKLAKELLEKHEYDSDEALETIARHIDDPEVEDHPLVDYAPHNLIRLYLSTFFLRAAFGTILILLPIYLSDLNDLSTTGEVYSGTAIGLIVGSYFLGEIFLVTVFGRWSDLIRKRKPFIFWGNIVAAGSFALFTIFTGPVELFVIHLIEGVGGAMVIGPSLAMVGDSTKVNERGKGMGRFEMATFGGIAAGMGIGAGLYTLLGEAEGQGRYTFVIVAVLLIFGAYFARTLKEPELQTQERVKFLRNFFRETIHDKIFLGAGAGLILFIWLWSAIFELLDGSFDIFAILVGSGFFSITTRVVMFSTGIFLIVVGAIDWYLEFTISEQDKKSLHVDGEEQKSHVMELIDAFKHKELKRILPAWLLVMTIIGVVTTFLPIILGEGINSPGEVDHPTNEAVSMGLESWQISLLFIGGVIVLAVTQIIYGRLVDSWGRQPMLILGLVSLVVLSADIVLIVGIWPEFFDDIFSFPGIIFIAIALIAGLGVSAFGPASLAVLADSSEHSNRGTSSGIYSLLMGVGELFGDAGAGVIWDHGESVLGVIGLDTNAGRAFTIFFLCFILAVGALISVISVRDIFDWSNKRSASTS